MIEKLIRESVVGGIKIEMNGKKEVCNLEVTLYPLELTGQNKNQL